MVNAAKPRQGAAPATIVGRLAGLGRALGGREGSTLGRSGAVTGLIVMAVLYVIYMIVQVQPRTANGFNTVLNESATVALAGVGEALIVLSGGYDLSAGSVVGLINVLLATRAGAASGTFLMVLIGLGCGIGAGLLNGVIVAYVRVPPIIATLSTLFVWEGVALLILPQPGGTVPSGFTNALSGSAGSISVALILFAVAAVIWRFVKLMPTGRHIYMLGGDPDSARANGININRTLVFTYGFAGFFYGMAGLYYTADTASGDPGSGAPLLLPIFAAVVLGGIIFGGGKGDPAAAIIGSVTLTLISDVLYAFGVSSFYTDIFDGAALIVALAAGVLSGRLFSWRGRRQGEAGGQVGRILAGQGQEAR